MTTVRLLTKPSIWCYDILSPIVAQIRIREPKHVRLLSFLIEFGKAANPALVVRFKWKEFSPEDTYTTGIQAIDAQISPGDVPYFLLLEGVRPSSYEEGILTIRAEQLELCAVAADGTAKSITCPAPPDELRLPMKFGRGNVPAFNAPPPA